MVARIEIASKVPDTRALVRKRRLLDDGFSDVREVILVDVYTVDKKLTSSQLQKIGHMLANPVTQEFSITNPLAPKSFSWAIEIGFLPGVTDNVANTTREMIEDLLKAKFKNGESVYTSQVIFIQGKLTVSDAQKIAATLYNPLIQRGIVKSFKEFRKSKGMGIVVPKVTLKSKPHVDSIDLTISDEQLTELGKKGIPNSDGTTRGPLALPLVYMKAIQKHFKKLGRKPTDVELESLAQTWSEHCKHTIFADPIDTIKEGLYKHFIKRATEHIRKQKGKKDFCVSVFHDNSGGIVFDEQYLITHKVETHNSPSALDPFGGAITGIVGVNRDALGFGLGAKPVANTYGFCFSDPRKEVKLFRDKDKTQPMLSARRIMDGVIAGVNSGGNCSGIPTPLGFISFDERFIGKPLVFVGTLGLIPKKAHGQKLYEKKAQPGDYIVMLGGAVGIDGIHGATFSSEALDSGSPATAVQIGDPITQKKLSDALVNEARDLGLYTSITDNGAGGLSCSVAEMAKECGGCVVDLEKVPLKYPGLSPWQIWISESQERMTLAVPPKKWKNLANLMQRRGVEAAVIGRFTDSGDCIVKYHGKTIVNLDMEFLHNGLPVRPMKTKKPAPPYSSSKAEGRVEKFSISSNNNYSRKLHEILQRSGITSYSFISQQYDHEVQAGSVLKPLQGKGRVNSDAAVFKPVLDSSKAVILSHGLYPTYSDIDTYYMAAASIDTAIRNAVAAGATLDHLALLDNFCWCSSDEPERLYQLKRAAQACYDYAVAYGTPFIAGKDSMFNDFKGFDADGKPVKISVPPTLVISSIGVIPDATKVVSLDLKFAGDLIYILGETHDECIEEGRVPQVDAARNKKLYEAYTRCVEMDLIASAISVTSGGLITALAKTAIGGMVGIDVSLKTIAGAVSTDMYALFSESQGRLIVSINPKNKEQFEKQMKGNAMAHIGKVQEDGKFNVRGITQKELIETKVTDLQKSYTKTFKNY